VDKKRLPDVGVLLAVALALLAALPFLLRPGLPRDTDAELHVFRAAEVSVCWQGGVIYPRWAPDLYFGYGYPIFNYYAPLTYHLASLIALLPGVSVVTGVKAVFVLGLIVGGLGTYLLVRDLFGPEAGVVGAAVFLFAPYVLLIDPHARGDLAEHFALCLLPLVSFLLRRLVAGGGRGALLGATIGIAALLLSHNLLGALGIVLAFGAFVWQVVVEGRRDGVGRGLLAFALAAALSAFFWLPMLLELKDVQLTVVGPGHFDFRNHFVPLAELLSPSRLVDMGAVAARYHHNLGLAQWLLALAGAAALARRGSPQRRALLFFVLIGVLLVFLMTRASLRVWETLPWLEYLQFPWRILGTAAFALAVLSGAATSWLPPARWRRIALGAFVLALLLLALPSMSPLPWSSDFGDTSREGVVAFELEGKVVGTTSTGDFLPRTVDMSPHPEPSLFSSYEGPGPVDKVNRATLPEGTTVRVLEHGPVHDLFFVSGSTDFVLRVYTLLFPGWHAYVDGEEVELSRGRPEGSLSLPVPAGDHTVLLRFEDTPPRRAGWAIAAGGVLMLALALVLVRGRPLEEREFPERLDGTSGAWIGGVLALFLVFKVGLVDPLGWLRHTSQPGEALAAQVSQHAVIGEQVEFLGFDLPRRTVRSGEDLTVVLYWRALRPLDVNYQSFAHLTHPSAVSWGQSDVLNPGGLPTTRWTVDRYVWDVHRVRVRPGTPPGVYALEVGLYTLIDGRRLPVLDAAGEAAGETVVLTVPVEVVAGRRPPDEDALGMDEAIGASYADQISLLGYATPSRVTDAPGFIHLTLFWQAQRRHPDDLVVTVAVVDAAGEPVAIASGPPAGGRYPTSRWSRGEVVRDAYAFWLGEDFAPGVYTVGVVVHRGAEPIAVEQAPDAFLELFDVEVRPWEG
jgi:hypothetical protein